MEVLYVYKHSSFPKPEYLQIKSAAAVSNGRSSLPFDVIIYTHEPLWMFNLWGSW